MTTQRLGMIAIGVVLVAGGAASIIERRMRAPRAAPDAPAGELRSRNEATSVIPPVAHPDRAPGVPLMSPEEAAHSVERKRENLTDRYLAFVESEQPNMNYIQVRLVKQKQGYFLQASHPFFNEHELDYGHFGPALQRWIDANIDELREQHVVRVGVKGDLGSTWFDVK